MIRNRLIRRALIPVTLLGATGIPVLAATTPAGAQVYGRIGVYTLTPTEYFNACPTGPGGGVVNYDGGAGNTANGMTLDCTKGVVTYTVAN